MTIPISPTGATVSPIAGMSTGAAGGTTSTDNGQLDSKTFLQLLVAQLQYQDPSKPVDTSAFMNETATLTQVQTMEQSAQNSTQLLSAQRAQTATNLVGHTVTYLADDGTTQSGEVTAATISAANPLLKIGTSSISLDQVQQVVASTTAG
ncbi:MAG TPA: flagellar hook capping FlgD N-terminal domain-containing protein [Jatrophihabitans sp.]|nr:flagellar hook capping FlgD N-terminal domain-containing protein [Jatrophihabitans sp.]